MINLINGYFTVFCFVYMEEIIANDPAQLTSHVHVHVLAKCTCTTFYIVHVRTCVHYYIEIILIIIEFGEIIVKGWLGFPDDSMPLMCTIENGYTIQTTLANYQWC